MGMERQMNLKGGEKGENKRCGTKREAERNSEGGKGRRMNTKINI